MKKLLLLLTLCLSFGLIACGNNENNQGPNNELPEVVEGTTYECTKVQFTTGDFNVYDADEKTYTSLSNGYVIISTDRTKLSYTNEMGTYVADLTTEYDGEMWYESVVTWKQTPTPYYGEHTLSTTTLIFDEERGLVRMNFALDGRDGQWDGAKTYIFNEFESK